MTDIKQITYTKPVDFQEAVTIHGKPVGGGTDFGEGANSIIQLGTGTAAHGEASAALGKSTTALGKAAHVEGFANTGAINNAQVTDISNESQVIAAWHKARNRIRGMQWDTKVAIANPSDDQKALYNDETDSDKRLQMIAEADYKVSDNMTVDNLDKEDYARIFTYASGLGAHAEGLNTLATGKGAHAEGSRTIASSSRAHAEGTDTSATNNNTHAEGQDTIASGNVAHAEGYGTEASGSHSHAQGVRTKSPGNTAHAEGFETKAEGAYSHAEGQGTIAKHQNQHVQGRLNSLENIQNYAHIIGNGTAVLYTNADKSAGNIPAGLDVGSINEEQSTRANIHTVTWGGDAWYAGELSIGGNAIISGSLSAEAITGTSLTVSGDIKDGNDLTLKGVNSKIAAILPTGSSNGGARMLGGSFTAGADTGYSLAAGYKCSVSSKHSFVMGANLTSTKQSQAALGYVNDPDETIRPANDKNDEYAIFMVGDGWGTTKRNAFVVNNYGDAKVRDDLYVGNSAYVNGKKVLVDGDIPDNTYTRAEIDSKLAGTLTPKKLQVNTTTNLEGSNCFNLGDILYHADPYIKVNAPLYCMQGLASETSIQAKRLVIHEANYPTCTVAQGTISIGNAKLDEQTLSRLIKFIGTIQFDGDGEVLV